MAYRPELKLNVVNTKCELRYKIWTIAIRIGQTGKYENKSIFLFHKKFTRGLHWFTPRPQLSDLPMVWRGAINHERYRLWRTVRERLQSE